MRRKGIGEGKKNRIVTSVDDFILRGFSEREISTTKKSARLRRGKRGEIQAHTKGPKGKGIAISSRGETVTEECRSRKKHS